jgi:hypothetical protein
LTAQFAPIAPLKIQRHLDLELGVFGNFHMVIASQVISNSQAWVDYYGERRDKLGMCEVILDNGMYEDGEPMPGRKLMQVVNILQPDWLVMPDKMGNKDATLELSSAFFDEYGTHLPAYTNFMGVAQGQTEDEVVECARIMTDKFYPRLTGIAVPRIVCDTFGTRISAVDRIAALDEDIEVHLLGFSRSLVDDIASAQRDGVLGIDSAYPIWVGEPVTTADRYRDAYRRPSDFWDWDLDKIDVDMVSSNIRQLRQIVANLP